MHATHSARWPWTSHIHRRSRLTFLYSLANFRYLPSRLRRRPSRHEGPFSTDRGFLSLRNGYYTLAYILRCTHLLSHKSLRPSYQVRQRDGSEVQVGLFRGSSYRQSGVHTLLVTCDASDV